MGEFVGTREEATTAKNEILTIMDAINASNVNAHVSIKLSLLGGEFDLQFAFDNLREILLKANEYQNMHVNIDTEKYDSLQQIIQALDKFKGEFKMSAQLYKHICTMLMNSSNVFQI